MSRFIAVKLQAGLLIAGKAQHEAFIREPTGHDELGLAGLAPGAALAALAQAALAALVQRIGECSPVSGEQLLGLTAGDRDRLLIAAAASQLGSHIDLVTKCPACQALMEVPVNLDELIALAPASPTHHLHLETVAGSWMVTLRPATGADIQNAMQAQPERSARALIESCIISLADPDGRSVAAAHLPSECEAATAAALAELDTLADCHASMPCPTCGANTDAAIDGITLLRSALSADPLRDVYRMARAYHWSEADILALPVSRRRRYLNIAASMESPA